MKIIPFARNGASEILASKEENTLKMDMCKVKRQSLPLRGTRRGRRLSPRSLQRIDKRVCVWIYSDAAIGNHGIPFFLRT